MTVDDVRSIVRRPFSEWTPSDPEETVEAREAVERSENRPAARDAERTLSASTTNEAGRSGVESAVGYRVNGFGNSFR